MGVGGGGVKAVNRLRHGGRGGEGGSGGNAGGKEGREGTQEVSIAGPQPNQGVKNCNVIINTLLSMKIN